MKSIRLEEYGIETPDDEEVLLKDICLDSLQFLELTYDLDNINPETFTVKDLRNATQT